MEKRRFIHPKSIEIDENLRKAQERLEHEKESLGEQGNDTEHVEGEQLESVPEESPSIGQEESALPSREGVENSGEEQVELKSTKEGESSQEPEDIIDIIAAKHVSVRPPESVQERKDEGEKEYKEELESLPVEDLYKEFELVARELHNTDESKRDKKMIEEYRLMGEILHTKIREELQNYQEYLQKHGLTPEEKNENTSFSGLSRKELLLEAGRRKGLIGAYLNTSYGEEVEARKGFGYVRYLPENTELDRMDAMKRLMREKKYIEALLRLPQNAWEKAWALDKDLMGKLHSKVGEFIREKQISPEQLELYKEDPITFVQEYKALCEANKDKYPGTPYWKQGAEFAQQVLDVLLEARDHIYKHELLLDDEFERFISQLSDLDPEVLNNLRNHFYTLDEKGREDFKGGPLAFYLDRRDDYNALLKKDPNNKEVQEDLARIDGITEALLKRRKEGKDIRVRDQERVEITPPAETEELLPSVDIPPQLEGDEGREIHEGIIRAKRFKEDPRIIQLMQSVPTGLEIDPFEYAKGIFKNKYKEDVVIYERLEEIAIQVKTLTEAVADIDNVELFKSIRNQGLKLKTEYDELLAQKANRYKV